MSEELALQIVLPGPFEGVEERVTAALKTEGFGLLTRIDVQATLREKLGVEFRRYVILGACNPPLAHRALEGHPLVGVLLPCNVTIDEGHDAVTVSFLNPALMAAMAPLSEVGSLRQVATQARARLERVAASLQAESPPSPPAP